jgi:polar amino acid transport system permease protein
MIWDWHFAGKILPDLLSGLWVTVEATLLGYLLSLPLGLLWAVLRRSPSVIVNQVVRWVVEFIRSTPLLVQLSFLFFVLLPAAGLRFSALATGVIGLGLHYSTYTAEVYRAGIADVPAGQWEATIALNLPRRRVWFGVVLPQAVRKVIPTLGNYLIAMFKDSPMLLGITVSEMLNRAYHAGAESFRFLEPITIVGVLFVMVSVLSSLLVRRLEARYGSN